MLLVFLKNNTRGPGAIKHQGGKCIHIYKGNRDKTTSGQNLVIYEGCGETRLEFKLLSDNKLVHINENMCVRPANDTDGSPVSKLLIYFINHFSYLVTDLGYSSWDIKFLLWIETELLSILQYPIIIHT